MYGFTLYSIFVNTVLKAVCYLREQKLSDVIDETMVESRMLVARFAIGEVNIGLNSRGKKLVL